MRRGLTWLQEMAMKPKPKVEATPALSKVEGVITAAELVVIDETRQQKWKRLHPEKVREGQRKLMAKRRAKNKP